MTLSHNNKKNKKILIGELLLQQQSKFYEIEKELPVDWRNTTKMVEEMAKIDKEHLKYQQDHPNMSFQSWLISHLELWQQRVELYQRQLKIYDDYKTKK